MTNFQVGIVLGLSVGVITGWCIASIVLIVASNRTTERIRQEMATGEFDARLSSNAATLDHVLRIAEDNLDSIAKLKQRMSVDESGPLISWPLTQRGNYVDETDTGAG